MQEQKPENSDKKEASYGGFQYRWNYDDYQRTRESKKKKDNHTGLKVFAITMTVVFLCCFTCLTGVLVYDYSLRSTGTPNETTNPNTTPTPQDHTLYVKPYSTDAETLLSIPAIAEKAKPSVVGILVTGAHSSSVGTGMILTADGYIVTNHHVVQDGLEYTVVLQDNTEIIGELVGVDTLTDLAVLKIEGNQYPAIEIGDSDRLVVGEPVVAIGTPAGITFAGTVTDGIVSAINRDVAIYDNAGKVVKTMTVIQTNANINPGNSGGPLLNNRGEVIGINTMKLSNGYEGIGFALPITGALPIIEALIQDGAVVERPEGSFAQGRPMIGISGEEINEYTAKIYRIPQGVMVKLVDPDSSAHKAGVQIGDIIVAFEGTEVTTFDEINAIKDKYKVGDSVTMKLFRNGEYLEISFQLDNGA